MNQVKNCVQKQLALWSISLTSNSGLDTAFLFPLFAFLHRHGCFQSEDVGFILEDPDLATLRHKPSAISMWPVISGKLLPSSLPAWNCSLRSNQQFAGCLSLHRPCYSLSMRIRFARDRSLQTGVSITDNQIHATQSPGLRSAQQFVLLRLVLLVHYCRFREFAVSSRIHSKPTRANRLTTRFSSDFRIHLADAQH